ncbi:MAG: hypothetical protein CUN49_17760, partial [Candidatus Thermofonsia Clade 1 bacterium]
QSDPSAPEIERLMARRALISHAIGQLDQQRIDEINDTIHHINQQNAALRTRRDTAIIALIWGGAPVVLMSYVSQMVHPFYLLLTLPALHALAGIGTAEIAHALKGRFAVLRYALILGLLG